MQGEEVREPPLVLRAQQVAVVARIDQLDANDQLVASLVDPASKQPQQPFYAKNPARAVKPPFLVLTADIIGIFGGYVVSVYKLDFNATNYLKRSWEFLEFLDVFSGLVKASVFGFLVALMGCYHGFNSKPDLVVAPREQDKWDAILQFDWTVGAFHTRERNRMMRSTPSAGRNE